MAQDFSVVRSVSKWVLGENGYLKEYTTHRAAIEFNADGSYKGVLVEPASTNEAKASEDLDNTTYWDFNNTTIATDTETDPKGGTNSFLLSETVDNLIHRIITLTAERPSVGSGETWTSSIFVKKGDGANAPDIVQMTNSGVTFGATNYANFDISVGGGTSGTVTASSGGTGRIRYYGNGWYRISFTDTSTSAGEAFVALLFTNNNPTAGRQPTYAGQTDANVFIWGAQLEESPIATSYIPTTTGAVTRVKDDIYLTSASSLIGQTEGTIFAEVDWREQGSGSSQFIFGAGDGADTDVAGIFYSNNSDELRMILKESNSAETNQGITPTWSSGVHKFVFAYKQNDCKLFVDGSEESADTSVDMTGFSVSEVHFGQNDQAGDQANMWIRAVALFTTRLSDAECEALTTI